MQIRDDVAPVWSLQKKEFLEGGEQGQEFVKYIETWCDAAERIYNESNSPTSLKNVRECLLEAMDVPESECGPIDGGYLGPMLMYIIHAWEHGEDLGMQLSRIEFKLVASAIAEQQARMQAIAEERAGNASAPESDVTAEK